MILILILMMIATSIICVFSEVSLAADSDRRVSSCSIPMGTAILYIIVTRPALGSPNGDRSLMGSAILYIIVALGTEACF